MRTMTDPALSQGERGMSPGNPYRIERNAPVAHSADVTDLEWYAAAMRAVLDDLPDVVIAFDCRFRLVFADLHRPNRRRGRPRELTGKMITGLPIFASDEMRTAALLAVSGRASSFRTRLALEPRSAEGSFDVRFSPVRDPAGGVIGGVAILRDCSEQVRTEDALRQSQRTESLGQLALGIVHDLNNLLSVITARLEQLTEVSYSPADQARFLNDAAIASQKGAALLRRLLALSQRSISVRQPIDVNQVIGELSDFLKRSLRPGIGLELRLAPELPLLQADRVQLDSALLNLVLNARDAIHDRGRIEIATSQGTAPDGQPLVILSVRDTGVGMPPDIRQRAFEPFFTTKGIGRGTGLGLMMVNRFVEEVGGQISIETAAGSGTCVQLTLPASPRAL